MKVIKCDICGKELDDANVYTSMSFTNYSSALDLCKECRDIYKIMEQSYLEEQDEIFEKREKDMIKLREKYKKEILKLRKNN